MHCDICNYDPKIPRDFTSRHSYGNVLWDKQLERWLCSGCRQVSKRISLQYTYEELEKELTKETDND